MSALRVGNAPLSYGAFEMTVGVFPNVPGPEKYLDEVTRAGFDGTELGVPGYLGEGDELRRRLDDARAGDDRRLVPDPLQRARALGRGSRGSGPDAVAVRGGGSDRCAPGVRRWRLGGALGQSGPRDRRIRSLGLDDAGWRRFLEGLKRAEDLARERGFEPTFHPHTSTHVEAPWEIDRLLETSDIGLLADTGHLLLGGNDPIEAVRSWGPRVNYVHVKDVRLDVLRVGHP